ncbi:MAG: UDP-N-acetylmuramate dehydrogenase [Lachnospiraceae bacterium]|nr:UDP-N-acetylmuramate dehydrogenase [Lachnospiraceae bacterium]
MKKQIENQLENIITEGVIKYDEPMSAHTTFRIGGKADCYIEPSFQEVEPLFAFLKQEQIPYTLIGNGSNLLVSDEGIEGVTVSFGTSIAEVSCEGTTLKAQAGILLSRLASFAAEHSLKGLEFASGIPGTLGGAITMNAGAYGGEMKDVVTYVTLLEDGEIKRCPASEMDFSYRHSKVLESDIIVLAVEMDLQEGNQKEILALSRELNQRRVDKQPLNYPSAGSTFKRPEGHFAGKLIEDAGLKGYTVGGAQVSEKHSGFVINIGGATAKDVRDLISDVKRIVKEKFDVTLEPEVRMIGRF